MECECDVGDVFVFVHTTHVVGVWWKYCWAFLLYALNCSGGANACIIPGSLPTHILSHIMSLRRLSAGCGLIVALLLQYFVFGLAGMLCSRLMLSVPCGRGPATLPLQLQNLVCFPLAGRLAPVPLPI